MAPSNVELPTVDGVFRILNVTLPSTCIHSNSSSSSSKDIIHTLYFKKNITRKPTPNLPENKTLFVVNIPVDSTISHFQRLFRRCGKVVDVQFHDSRRHDNEWLETERRIWASGSNAHVIFDSEEAVERALAMRVRKRIWTDELGEKDIDDSMNSEVDGLIVKSEPLGLKRKYCSFSFSFSFFITLLSFIILLLDLLYLKIIYSISIYIFFQVGRRDITNVVLHDLFWKI